MSLGTDMALRRMRIVVLGYLVRGPLGGMAWHHLQYMLGLARLGHDVWFLEDGGEDPCPCYDPSHDAMTSDPSYGLQFAARAFGRLGLEDRWAYHDRRGQGWVGPGAAAVGELWRSADLLLNLSGANILPAPALEIPVRVYVDTDPVFTQIRHLTVPERRRRAMQHTSFFSFAGGIGGPRCTIPDDGFPWRPTRQPVVLDAWPVVPPPARGCYTTVLAWESYPARAYAGKSYGMKSASFRKIAALPRHVPQEMELALGGAGAPRDRLRRNGWRLRNPLEVAGDPWDYQRYLQGSRAEFTVAKHGYVAARTGWFSERSAGYLASGRPVLTEETGFSDWLPTGTGLLSFKTRQQAVEGIAAINRGYRRHCAAARKLAEEYFDARTVLGSLLERAMNGQ